MINVKPRFAFESYLIISIVHIEMPAGHYEGFNISPYSNPMSIQPKERAIAFQQQVQVMVQERKNIRIRFGDDSYKYHWDSIGQDMDDADERSEKDLWKDANDSKGDSWLDGIMSQRRSMKKQLMSRYAAEQDQREAHAKYVEAKREEECERAFAASAKRDEERAEVEFQRRNRIDAANAELRADRYAYLKKLKAQQKYEKGIKDALAQQKRVQPLK